MLLFTFPRLFCFTHSVTLSPSGSVLLCEGERLQLLCEDTNTSAQWNITGVHEKSDSDKNPLLLGPVRSMDSGATVQCEASGEKSDTTRLLVGETYALYFKFVPTYKASCGELYAHPIHV